MSDPAPRLDVDTMSQMTEGVSWANGSPADQVVNSPASYRAGAEGGGQANDNESEEMVATERDLAEDAQWKRIQQNTFTRWANEHLKTVDKYIANLETDLSDGLKLIALIEVLSGKKLPKHNKKPTFRSQKLENVSVALRFLECDEGIRIVNIGESICHIRIIPAVIFAAVDAHLQATGCFYCLALPGRDNLIVNCGLFFVNSGPRVGILWLSHDRLSAFQILQIHTKMRLCVNEENCCVHLLPAAEHYSTDLPIVCVEKMRRFVVETPEHFGCVL